MIEKVYDFIKKNRMFENCTHIVTGLSGGADSVCLLAVIKNIIDSYGLDIGVTAVHINHGIRGMEADRDEEFAKNTAASLGADFECYHIDVPFISEKEGLSEETAGRIERYRIFEEVRKRFAADNSGLKQVKIAVAHHMDDQAETVLMHLFRGCGIKGMCGMQPVSGDIIRPMLCVTRQEIEQYLIQHHIAYVNDSTNDCDDYKRNRIRNIIIPQVKNDFNPEVVSGINILASDLSGINNYIDYLADKAEKNYIIYGESIISISDDIKKLSENERVILERLVMRAIVRAAKTPVNIYRKHVVSVLELLDAETGKSVSLPYGLVARKDYKKIDIFRNEMYIKNVIRSTITVSLDELRVSGKTELKCEDAIYFDGKKIKTFILKMDVISKKDPEFNKCICDIGNLDEVYNMYFDLDELGRTVEFRTRRTGDYIIIDKECHRKKLKQELIDKKIPAAERDMIMLMARNDEVLWAAGVRRGASCHIGKNTENILCVSILPKEEDNG